MLLLTLAVVSFSVPTLFRDQNPFFQFNLEQAVRGLVGVVLLFNTYALYQNWALKRLQRQLAQQIENAARLETRAELLQRLAMHDPLTGLSNRRVAEDRLAGEVSRSRRYGHALTIITFDLDDFKRINDVYGHAAGDLVLKAFADRLSRVIRTSDIAVRMGGDEFLLILPECPESQVPVLLERVGSVSVEIRGKTIPFGYSAGWAGYRPDESPGSLLERADQLLYARKRRARQPETVTAP